MKKTEVFDIVLTSVFAAIIFLMGLVPQIGFITLAPGISLTLVHIPTLIGIFILKPKFGWTLGLFFGISSLIAAFIYAANPTDLAFQNPLVSVLPRVLFGLTAWGIFTGLKMLAKLKFGNYVIFGVVALITSFAMFYGVIAIANASGADQNLINQVITPITLVLIAVFLTGYFILATKKEYSDIVVPSSFVLGTLAHTVLVLSFMIPLAFSSLFATFGDAIAFIYTTTAFNGLIEALLAVIIGTPIYLTLKQLPMMKNRTY